MGVMQLNNHNLDQKDIQLDVLKEKEKDKDIRRVTELDEESL